MIKFFTPTNDYFLWDESRICRLGSSRLKSCFSFSYSKAVRFCICFLLTSCLLITYSAEAQSKKKRLKISKGRSFRTSQVNINDASFSDSISNILSGSVDTDLYDPVSILRLQTLRDRANPWWEREDFYDEDESQRIVEKALAIQTSSTFFSLLKKSDIRNEYKSAEREFRSFTERFRYALQDTGTGYTFSNDRKGNELLELSLKFSVNQGADPQVSISDSCRIRYDWAEQQTMLEFGFNF